MNIRKIAVGVNTSVEPLPECDVTGTHNVPLQKHYILMCVLFHIVGCFSYKIL